MSNMDVSEEQYGVSNMETPEPNDETASKNTLLNLSYSTPPIKEPQKYLYKKQTSK